MRALAFLPLLLLAGGANAHEHAIAMHGQPKLGPDYTHFAHVDPSAPRGGRLVLIQPNHRLCAEHYFDDPTHRTIFDDRNIGPRLAAQRAGLRAIARALRS